MGLSNIDIEPIDAVLIALDPLDREPTLLSRSTQSVLVQNQFSTTTVQ